MPIIEKMKGIVNIEEGEPAADIRVAFSPPLWQKQRMDKSWRRHAEARSPYGKAPKAHLHTFI